MGRYGSGRKSGITIVRDRVYLNNKDCLGEIIDGSNTLVVYESVSDNLYELIKLKYAGLYEVVRYSSYKKYMAYIDKLNREVEL